MYASYYLKTCPCMNVQHDYGGPGVETLSQKLMQRKQATGVTLGCPSITNTCSISAIQPVMMAALLPTYLALHLPVLGAFNQ